MTAVAGHLPLGHNLYMPNHKYKIAVIGPIPKDHITTYKGLIAEKYGCITHSVIALSNLLGNQAEIYPVTHVRKKDVAAIEVILKDLPGVHLDYIDATADQGDIIRLRFIDQNERVKTMSGFMNPIVIDDIKNILEFDAFLFLPVTDFEISLDAVKFLKEHSNGLIIFDAHGQTKTMTTLGDRLFKFWVDRDQWLPYIDVLKMNLREAKCAWPKKRFSLEELEDDEPLPLAELPHLARHCLKLGVKALYITLDERGCLLYTEEDGDLRETLIPAIPIDHVDVVDSTGCGDSFAGGLTHGLLTTHNYIKAGQFANSLGAQCLTGINFDCFQSLSDTERMIKETYGED